MSAARVTVTPVQRRDYGPHQLADYLGALWGRVDNARHFGLLPEPDRARGRWSAALAEEIRARWDEIDAAAKCIGAPGLRERGWTEAMIRDFLGEPDLYVDNPHYKSAASMRLWRLQRAEAAEQTPEFAKRRERAERERPVRLAAAAQAVETKQIWNALVHLGDPRPPRGR
jgi:hypothetical protein